MLKIVMTIDEKNDIYEWEVFDPEDSSVGVQGDAETLSEAMEDIGFVIGGIAVSREGKDANNPR